MTINLIDQTFTRWTVLEPKGKTRHGSVLWKCKCECGTLRLIDGQSLRKGVSRSCGCLRDELTKTANTKHGEAVNRTPSPEYTAFNSAKSRCQNPNNTKFADYGGRGIEFRFTSFTEFLRSVGRKPTRKHSLERDNVNGHYEPGNVRWATINEQSLNKRNNHIIEQHGKRWTISQWAVQKHLPASTIRSRIFQHGWCGQCAIEIPVWGGRCYHLAKSKR